jgi:hypothetical protein
MKKEPEKRYSEIFRVLLLHIFHVADAMAVHEGRRVADLPGDAYSFACLMNPTHIRNSTNTSPLTLHTTFRVR